MTGINATKVIQNLQIMNSFGLLERCASSSRGNRTRKRKRENKVFLFGFFLRGFFDFQNWFRKPGGPPPADRGAGRRGVSACLQFYPNPRLGPGLPSDTLCLSSRPPFAFLRFAA